MQNEMQHGLYQRDVVTRKHAQSSSSSRALSKCSADVIKKYARPVVSSANGALRNESHRIATAVVSPARTGEVAGCTIEIQWPLDCGVLNK